MAQPRPYQTLIFRSLHASQGILTLFGMLTGYWIYNTWDGRFAHIPLWVANESIIDSHSAIGGLFTGIFLLFILYSLNAGRRRLIQPKSFQQLGKVGKPIWWYNLHRFVNTGLLIMGLLIIVSGEGLDDDVLEAGLFSDLAYSLHLFAWVGMVLLTAAHTILSLKVGGLPLILSMVTIRMRLSDRPFNQLQRIYQWGKQHLF